MKKSREEKETDLEIVFLSDWDLPPVSNELAAIYQQAFMDGLIAIELDRYDARMAALEMVEELIEEKSGGTTG